VQNVAGQKILSQKYASIEGKLELEINESPGVYFIEITSDGKKTVLKFIKQ
jgi:hypothetical protein